MYAIRMNNGGLVQNFPTQNGASEILQSCLAKDLLPPKMQAGRIGVVVPQAMAFDKWELALHGALEVWISDCTNNKVTALKGAQ